MKINIRADVFTGRDYCLFFFFGHMLCRGMALILPLPKRGFAGIFLFISL